MIANATNETSNTTARCWYKTLLLPQGGEPLAIACCWTNESDESRNVEDRLPLPLLDAFLDFLLGETGDGDAGAGRLSNPSQQANLLLSIVGQQRPVSPAAAQLGLSLQDSCPGDKDGLSSVPLSLQQSKVCPKSVGL